MRKQSKERIGDLGVCFNCATTGIQSGADSKNEHVCSTCNIHIDYYKFIDLRVIILEMMLCIDRSARFYLAEGSFNFRKHARFSTLFIVLIDFMVNAKFAILTSPGVAALASESLHYQNSCLNLNSPDSHIGCWNVFKLIRANPDYLHLLGLTLLSSVIKFYVSNIVTYLLINVIGGFGRKIPTERIWTSICFNQLGKLAFFVVFLYDHLYEDASLKYIKVGLAVHQVLKLVSYISSLESEQKANSCKWWYLIVAIGVWVSIGVASVGVSFGLGTQDQKWFMEGGQEFISD
jgi:hypothetical protein